MSSVPLTQFAGPIIFSEKDSGRSLLFFLLSLVAPFCILLIYTTYKRRRFEYGKPMIMASFFMVVSLFVAIGCATFIAVNGSDVTKVTYAVTDYPTVSSTATTAMFFTFVFGAFISIYEIAGRRRKWWEIESTDRAEPSVDAGKTSQPTSLSWHYPEDTADKSSLDTNDR